MYVKKNIINANFIKKINAYLDNVSYKDSLWIFPGEHPKLYKLIINNLSSTSFFKSILNKNDCYIVLRMINQNDIKRSLEAHFDNYSKTYFIPLKIPEKNLSSAKRNMQGNLFLWEKARLMPKSLTIHICTKIIFQNKYISKIIRWLNSNSFKEVSLNLGDVLYFNGFTTFHYTSLVSSEHRSLVIHTDMPFKGNKIARLIDQYSRYRVK